MTIRCAFAVLSLLLSSSALVRADGPAAPKGLKGEQAYAGRQAHVAADALRLCQPANGFWVDLGAGDGQVAMALAEKTGNAVLMIDPKAEALARGLENGRQNALQGRLMAVVGVAEKLPLADNSVDWLVSRGSIFFWDDPSAGLKEVHRVLRPGAKAYIGGGAGSGFPKDLAERLVRERRQRMDGPEAERWRQFVALRRPEQMRKWAQQAGLSAFRVLGQGAISADDPQVGQGVWLLLEKK